MNLSLGVTYKNININFFGFYCRVTQEMRSVQSCELAVGEVVS